MDVEVLVTQALTARTRIDRAEAERREAAAAWRQAVAALYYELGATAAARRLGITRERVHQIAREAGVGRARGRRVSVGEAASRARARGGGV
ncbi:MAG: hypothetical protein M3252_04375 [Actinomycetota bacterium]|nr:hypothetical protein [Actinomycetota bacterium]